VTDVRIRLGIAYDGAQFSGWAIQPGRRTVAGVLTAGLARVLRLDPAAVVLTVAGRTDAGVHATGQVAHLDVPVDAWAAQPGRSTLAPSDALVRRLAGVLPRDVRVPRADLAPAGFDARFAALWRRYAYRLSDEQGGVNPLRRHDVVDHRRRLDPALMDAAAATLVGLHDFAAFCRHKPNGTTVRTLLDFRWEREPDGVVVGHVRADAFCHSMVRSLVGAVLPVGEGRRPVDWPRQVLLAATRNSAVDVAPPHGLTLEQVCYPPDEGLAARAVQARNRRDGADGGSGPAT
jgi:tRNA pseudouridine38-40 synthase